MNDQRIEGEAQEWQWEEDVIEKVKQFKYLWFVFKSTNVLKRWMKENVEQANKLEEVGV